MRGLFRYYSPLLFFFSEGGRGPLRYLQELTMYGARGTERSRVCLSLQGRVLRLPRFRGQTGRRFENRKVLLLLVLFLLLSLTVPLPRSIFADRFDLVFPLDEHLVRRPNQPCRYSLIYTCPVNRAPACEPFLVVHGETLI